MFNKLKARFQNGAKILRDYSVWMASGFLLTGRFLKNPFKFWKEQGPLFSWGSKKWPRIRRVVQIAIISFFVFWIFVTRDGGEGVQTRSGMENYFSPIHEAHRIIELVDGQTGIPRQPTFQESINPAQPIIQMPDGNYYTAGAKGEYFMPDAEGNPVPVRLDLAFAFDISNPNLAMDLKLDPSLKAVSYENLIIATDLGKRYFYSRLNKDNEDFVVPVHLQGYSSATLYAANKLKYFKKYKYNPVKLKEQGLVAGKFMGGAPVFVKKAELEPIVKAVPAVINGEDTNRYLMRTSILYRGERKVSILQWSPVAGGVTGLALKEWVREYWVAIALVLLAIPFGRFFCGWLCPMGISIDIFDKFFATKNEIKSVSDEKQPKYIKYIILFGIIGAAIFGVNISGWFDPLPNVMRGMGLAVYQLGDGFLKFVNDHVFTDPSITFAVAETTLFDFSNPVPKMRVLPGAERWYQFLGTPFILIVFFGILMLGLIHKRFWCQHLCPLGAFYAAWSLIPGLKRVVDLNKCTNCMSCEVNCRMNAIDHYGEQNIKGECIQCMSCLDDCNDDAIRFEFTTENEERLKKDTPIFFSRRKFAGSMLFAGLGFLVWKTGKTVENRTARQLIRPPGARTSVEGEDAFSQACIRCGECMKVCVNNALHPVPLGEGDLATLWTPMLVSRIGSCEYKCTLCGEVCPTDAIRPFTFTEYADGSIDDRKWYLEQMEVQAAISKEAYNRMFYIKDPEEDIHYTAVRNFLKFHGESVQNIALLAIGPKYMDVVRTLITGGYKGKFTMFGDLNRILLERRLSKEDYAFYEENKKQIDFKEYTNLHKLSMTDSGRMQMTLREVNEINQATFSDYVVDMTVSPSKKERRFIGTAVFDETRCYPYLDHNPTPCTVCEEVCPVSDDSRGGKAIQVDIKKVYNKADQEWIEVQQPYIVHDICVGCGICEQECPSGKVDGYVASRAAVYVAPPNYDYRGDDWDKKTRDFKPGEKRKLEEEWNKKYGPKV